MTVATARAIRTAAARVVGVALVVAGLAAITVAPTPARAGLPGGIPFVTLQLNLCNSGEAACYRSVNNGRSVAEAAAVLAARRPDVVTLNEICRSDLAVDLNRAMVSTFPGSRVFWAFKAAGDRRDGGPYRCRDGDQYGIGVLGRVRAADWAGTAVRDGLYPVQDGSVEMRAWVCAAAVGSYVACATHLESSSATVARAQCERLMDVEIPAFRAAVGASAPVVVGGDLNLRAPDAQGCVPPGYYGVGDGDLQQVLASTDLAFGYARPVPLRFTDHPGWLVGVTP
jgi:endonuclease/exonuclease/phosphatase family metal-dependent hydrolase